MPVLSQESILLKGKVVADSLNNSAINIVNFTQKTGTTNNASGEFVLAVRKNDTLIFSSVQYNIEEIFINDEILENQFLEVRLSEKVNELEEVGISNISLTGNLDKDLKDLKVFSQADIGFAFSSKPTPTLMQRKMSAATGSALELLINTLNGRIKNLKKAREFMEFDAMVDLGIDAVPTEFFVENLFIPKEEIMNFVTFCAEGAAYHRIISRKDHLALIELFYLKAPEFLAQNGY